MAAILEKAILEKDGKHVWLKITPRVRSEFTFKARLTAKTGKLLRITAGCRDWPSFSYALNHYDPSGVRNLDGLRITDVGGLRWSNDWCEHHRADSMYIWQTRGRVYAIRDEARAVLCELQSAVWAYQRKCQKRRERERKKGKR
jgi:hypothetical protein